MSQDKVTIKSVPSIESVGRQAWDLCANPRVETMRSSALRSDSEITPFGSTQNHDLFNPFLSYDFLHALETSRSVGHGTGWTPLHIVVAEDISGAVHGVMPAYGKSHSQGEYVFDWNWAEAYERAGGRYYPKLQIAIPFTPVTSRRFLIAPEANADTIRQALLAGAKHALQAIRGSSIHATFLRHDDWLRFADAGFLKRTDRQFHWINEGYQSFDDFLATLSSRKRKAIKRERRDVLSNGLAIERLTGRSLTEEAWDAFFQFYMDTGSRKWGRPYLTREFFSAIAQTMAEHILLVMAKRDGRYIAGAINFIGSGTLYGRHWGCIEEHPFLHFEVCYYQAIEFAIERGLTCVEAGAQGEHKLARGYRPVTTYSAHSIADPRLRKAVEDYLAFERARIDEIHAALEEATPFKKR